MTIKATSNTDTTSCHGVLMDVLGTGVMLKGVSGIGKSELALGLIDRGHHLIADDSVFLQREPNHLIGSCPELLQDFLEIRGLGILNIRAMFGDAAIKSQKQLQLIVNIINIDAEEILSMDRLNGLHDTIEILGISVPQVSIPVAPGRNLSILVESAVRNQILTHTGYNAGAEFASKQREQIKRESL